jgi:undecaprenyl-diphosphatase
LSSLDLALLRALYVGDGPAAWRIAALVASFLGSGWMLLALLPGLAVRRLRWITATALATLLLTSGTVTSIKALTARVRPCNALAWAHTLLLDVPSDGSFPSGHAAGSFAFAAFVWSSDRRAGWPIVAFAFLVAISRVALGVHYPSDVAAGAVLGAALGWAGARVYRSRFLPDVGSSPSTDVADSSARPGR